MKPVPRIFILSLGVTILVSMVYLTGRYNYLRHDMQLPPVHSAFNLEFSFSPLQIAVMIVLSFLSATPPFIVRNYPIGSWLFFAASLGASSILYSMTMEWSAKVMFAHSDGDYFEGLILMSLLLYVFLSCIATVWASRAKSRSNSESARSA